MWICNPRSDKFFDVKISVIPFISHEMIDPWGVNSFSLKTISGESVTQDFKLDLAFKSRQVQIYFKHSYFHWILRKIWWGNLYFPFHFKCQQFHSEADALYEMPLWDMPCLSNSCTGPVKYFELFRISNVREVWYGKKAFSTVIYYVLSPKGNC